MWAGHCKEQQLCIYNRHDSCLCIKGRYNDVHGSSNVQSLQHYENKVPKDKAGLPYYYIQKNTLSKVT